MKVRQFVQLLAGITLADGEKSAFAAALPVVQAVLCGHYYSAVYGRTGCASVDVLHPGESWLGIDSEIARTIARHHLSHPFSRDFFARARASVYLRSQMVAEIEWKKSEIYRHLDSRLGIADMIGLYFPLPSGQFGALFCGARQCFAPEELAGARQLHRILVPLLTGLDETIHLEPGSDSGTEDLSSREHEVMQWLSQGKSNEEIGLLLGISQHTVRKHLEHVFRKLAVENRTAAVREYGFLRNPAK